MFLFNLSALPDVFVVDTPQELLLLDYKVGGLSRGEFGGRVERFDGGETGMFKGGGTCVMFLV